jgi:protein TonB
LFQPIRDSSASRLQWTREKTARRAAGIVAALLLEALLLLLLLTLGQSASQPSGVDLTVVNLKSQEAPEPAPAEPEPEPEPEPVEPLPEEPQPAERPEPVVSPPVQPVPAPPERPSIRIPLEQVPAPEAPKAPARPAPPASDQPAYGPPDRGRPADTARVGTAPNGEPLYAATWYREFSESELRGYLSTASGPGWGLIACRTAADYRVEDCVALDEYPNGSNIARAVLAAAWQFRVRPPRLGGRPQIGEWVRIRIDYGITRQ